MSVGIVVPLPAYTLNPAFIAKKAEALGFESIWYHEHPILPVDSASPFPATGGGFPGLTDTSRSRIFRWPWPPPSPARSSSPRGLRL